MQDYDIFTHIGDIKMMILRNNITAVLNSVLLCTADICLMAENMNTRVGRKFWGGKNVCKKMWLKRNKGCPFYVAQNGSCRGSFIIQKACICRQFTVRFLPCSSTCLISYGSLECSKFPADASDKTARFQRRDKINALCIAYVSMTLNQNQ